MPKEQKAIQKQGRVIVEGHYPGDVKTKEERDLEVQTFEVEPAYIGSEYGFTIALPQKFNMVRLKASVLLPTYVEEIPAAFKRAWEIAEKAIEDKIDETKERRF